MEIQHGRPHTKGLDSEPDFGTNPCGEILLGEAQECVLPHISFDDDVELPHTKGLYAERRTLNVIIGHSHSHDRDSEPGIIPWHTGNYTPNLKIRYNESRS